MYPKDEINNKIYSETKTMALKQVGKYNSQ